MQHRPTARSWLLLLSLVGLWGTAFMFVKLAVADLPPTTLVATRVIIAALVLTVVVYARGLRLPTAGAVWARYLLMGFVGNALPFTLISWGQVHVSSSTTGILMAAMPLVTLVLAHFYVEGERLVARTVAGFLLGAAGIVVLSGPEALRQLGGEASDIVYQGAILGGAICYATNTILTRRLATLDALVSSATVMWCASALIIPIALQVDTPDALEASLVAMGSAVWLGLGATALATIIYFHLVATAGPTFLSLMNYLIPVVALIAGIAFLDESASTTALLGLGLILAGLAIASGR